MRVWIDGDIQVGTIGYLVETMVAGRAAWSLHDRPVTGWCAVGKVMRRNKARDRVQILHLHRGARDAFLRDNGHAERVSGASGAGDRAGGAA